MREEVRQVQGRQGQGTQAISTEQHAFGSVGDALRAAIKDLQRRMPRREERFRCAKCGSMEWLLGAPYLSDRSIGEAICAACIDSAYDDN